MPDLYDVYTFCVEVCDVFWLMYYAWLLCSIHQYVDLAPTFAPDKRILENLKAAESL